MRTVVWSMRAWGKQGHPSSKRQAPGICGKRILAQRGGSMKLLTEYLEHALTFKRLAAGEED
jgi:hypothetical protein